LSDAVSRAFPEVLLFDVGNVLIEVDFDRVTAAWAAAAGVPAERLAGCVVADEAYCAHETGELDHPGFFAALRERLGLALDDEALLAGWNEIFAGPVPGMDAVLRALSGRFRLFGFSNTNRAHVAHFTPRYASLLEPLEQVFASCELGLRKPHAEAFAEVARRIGARPRDILFFDDVEENVAGARAAGFQACTVRSAADVRAALTRIGLAINENS